jgi:hypothetical protein
MPKTEIVSPKIREPSGHFSQAIMIEARGCLIFISGMTARRADGTNSCSFIDEEKKPERRPPKDARLYPPAQRRPECPLQPVSPPWLHERGSKVRPFQLG